MTPLEKARQDALNHCPCSDCFHQHDEALDELIRAAKEEGRDGMCNQIEELERQRAMLHEHVGQACQILGLKLEEVPCDSWTLREQCVRVVHERDELRAKLTEAERELSAMRSLCPDGIPPRDYIRSLQCGIQIQIDSGAETARQRDELQTQLADSEAARQHVIEHLAALHRCIDEELGPPGGIGYVVPDDVHERGWQWRPVGDGAFAPPFGTIRVCDGCGCLVAGGPTACRRCADGPCPAAPPEPNETP